MSELAKITLKDLLAHKDKFEQRIASETTAAAQVAEVDPLLERAALAPTFRPNSIASEAGLEPSEEAMSRLLDQSAPTFDAAGETVWTLRDDVRREVLRSLHAGKKLTMALADYSGDDDATRQILQSVSSGHSLDTASLSREQLAASLRVVDWMEGIVDVPSKEEIAARMDRLEIVATLQKLAAGKFAGRADELARLADYVQTDDRGANAAIPPLAITGPGGMGKSTLLAEFLLRHLITETKPRCPFAYLDFDRRSLSIERPVTLLDEALRQLAAWYPEQSHALNQMRVDWHHRTHTDNPTMQHNLESITFATNRHTGAFIHDFCQALVSLDRTAPHFILILDTFEELQGRSQDYVLELDRFLRDLRDQMVQLNKGAARLRVIFSGRAPITEFETAEFPLKELDAKSSQQFLQQLGVHPQLTERVVNQVRGVPLTLRLAATLMLDSQDEILADGHLDHLHPVWYQLHDEELQGLIYRRYLQQIHDEDVRKLAHPGLVLRRITPEIIERVLAQPCGLRLVTEAEQSKGKSGRTPRQLFDALAREVSLVSSETSGELRHRPDLRAVMLSLLTRDEPKKVQRIHRNAVDYYQAFQSIPERAEEIYHRLQLSQSERKISERWLEGVDAHLSTCLAELPATSRPILATRLGADAALEDDAHVRGETDQATWERFTARRVERLLKLNQPKAALDTLRERVDRLPGSKLYPLEASACKYMEDWIGMRNVALQGIESAANAGNPKLAYELGQSLIQAILLSGQTDGAEKVIQRARRIPLGGTGTRNSAHETRNIAYRLELDLAELQVVEAKLKAANAPSESMNDIFETAESRFRELLAKTRSPNYAPLARHAAGLLGYRQPDLVAYVLQQFGLGDELNKTRQRLLARACITWDQIVSANQRRPDGVLIDAAGLRSQGQRIEDAWSQLTQSPSSAIQTQINALLERFGLPDNATRRFIEFFRLPHESEMFAPIHTKLLVAMSIQQLRLFTKEAFGIELDSIAKGTDERDLGRQLISWAYSEGRFQELIDRAEHWVKQSRETDHRTVSPSWSRLPGEQFRLVNRALLTVFRHPREFEIFLRDRMDISVDQISSGVGPFTEVMHDVLTWCEQNGRTRDLIAAVLAERPFRVEELLHVASILGISAQDAPIMRRPPPFTEERPATYMDPEAWYARRAALELTLCCIVLKSKHAPQLAIGMLVAADLVLTTGLNDKRIRECQLRFVDSVDAKGLPISETTYDLAENPVIASGSQRDLNYLLLRVNRSPGDDGIIGLTGHERRGWLAVSAEHNPVQNEGSYLLYRTATGKPLVFRYAEKAIENMDGVSLYHANEAEAASPGGPVVATDWHIIALQSADHSGRPVGTRIDAIVNDIPHLLDPRT